MEKKLKILIFGATGMAGSGVLDACLDDPRVDSVKAIVRKHTGIKSSKITEIIHKDFMDYDPIKNELSGFDACFWCLGISTAQAGGEKNYKRITKDFTLKAAKILSEVNPEMTFHYISGAGTNPNSKTMWARVKGETEKELGNFGFKQNVNLRPAMIYTDNGKKHTLWVYRWFAYLAPITRILLPSLHISNKELGTAMINITLKGSDKTVLENKEIRSFL
jgi:uncharacterized protein YbjT (DUF2867 family)